MVDEQLTWLTGSLLRAARALTGLTAKEVAQVAGVGEATIKRAEAADGQPSLTRANVRVVLEAYRSLGVHIEGVAGSKNFEIRFQAID